MEKLNSLRSFLCRYEESIDDLRVMYERKERKIKRKQETYKAFREKLSVSYILYFAGRMILVKK